MATEEVIDTSVDVSDKTFKFEGSHFKLWQQKRWFFFTLKKLSMFTNDIPIVLSRSNEQTNGKKYVDSDETVNSD